MSNIIEWTSKLTGRFRRAVHLWPPRREVPAPSTAANYDLIHDNQSLSYGMLQLQDMGLPLVTTVHHPITSPTCALH